MNRRKLCAPVYYREFTCIADKCRHSCCVGWEIDVDEDTAHLYDTLTEGYGTHIRASIDVEGDPDTPHFRLGAGDRCPHLAPNGLCRIITELGEGYLCEICREHPRFYHDTPHGKEVGIGMACEEACRVILESDGYGTFEEIETFNTTTDKADTDFDATTHRTALYAVLSDRALPYSERLLRIEQAWNVTPAALSDKEWRSALSELEYLDEAHRALFGRYTSAPRVPTEAETSLERALAYFIYRHVSPSLSEHEVRAALGFSLLCERLLASIAPYVAGGIREAARIVSEELEYSEDNTEAIKDVFW
jgi:lysine-N-methylase